MTDIPYLARLREELRAGIQQRRRRRARRRRIALIGAPGLAAAAAIAVSLAPSDAPVALAIEAKGAWIELRIADPEATVERMNGELHGAGIDAVVRLVPVPPSLVGRWACVAEVPDGRPAGRDPDGRGRRYDVRLSEVRYTRRVVRIRRDFARTRQDGRLVFLAGRPPRSDEHPSERPCVDLRRLAPDLVPPVLNRGRNPREP